MSTILSIALLTVQVIAAIPEAPIQLRPIYVSSRQEAKLKLSGPAAMAVARSGNIYVFDDGNSRVVKLDPRGKFVTGFGRAEAIEPAGLNDSIAVDDNENVYVTNPATPKVSIFNSNGEFQRSFRVPFAMTSIAVNKRHEIFLTADTTRASDLIYVFSETGAYLRRFGDKLIKSPGRLARNINIAVVACAADDKLFVAFRSWPLIRKYSSEGKLISENGFTIPEDLIKEAQRKYYSQEFFAKNPDSSFVPPLITHSITISGTDTGYLLLNAHSIVVFASSGQFAKQFRFHAPRDRDNVFIRLVTTLKAKSPVYLLDTRSGEIYEATLLTRLK